MHMSFVFDDSDKTLKCKSCKCEVPRNGSVMIIDRPFSYYYCGHVCAAYKFHSYRSFRQETLLYYLDNSYYEGAQNEEFWTNVIGLSRLIDFKKSLKFAKIFVKEEISVYQLPKLTREFLMDMNISSFYSGILHDLFHEYDIKKKLHV